MGVYARRSEVWRVTSACPTHQEILNPICMEIFIYTVYSYVVMWQPFFSHVHNCQWFVFFFFWPYSFLLSQSLSFSERECFRLLFVSCDSNVEKWLSISIIAILNHLEKPPTFELTAGCAVESEMLFCSSELYRVIIWVTIAFRDCSNWSGFSPLASLINTALFRVNSRDHCALKAVPNIPSFPLILMMDMSITLSWADDSYLRDFTTWRFFPGLPIVSGCMTHRTWARSRNRLCSSRKTHLHTFSTRFLHVRSQSDRNRSFPSNITDEKSIIWLVHRMNDSCPYINFYSQNFNLARISNTICQSRHMPSISLR